MFGLLVWLLLSWTGGASANPQFEAEMEHLGLRLTFREGAAPRVTDFDTDPTLKGRIPHYRQNFDVARVRNRSLGQRAPIGLQVGPGRSQAPAHR